MARLKMRQEYLNEASAEELLEELRRRRQVFLRDCSDEEIEAELTKRPGVDTFRFKVPEDQPPKLVEKQHGAR